MIFPRSGLAAAAVEAAATIFTTVATDKPSAGKSCASFELLRHLPLPGSTHDNGRYVK
jgi:hypothetical protein